MSDVARRRRAAACLWCSIAVLAAGAGSEGSQGQVLPGSPGQPLSLAPPGAQERASKDDLLARLARLPAGGGEAVSRECEALALDADDLLAAGQRAAALDQLRDGCRDRLPWSDPVLVRIGERAVERRRALAAEEPAQLCAALRALALGYHIQSRLDEALRLDQEAVAVARRYLGRGTSTVDLAMALESQSTLLIDLRRFQEAREAAAAALDLCRRAVPYRPEDEVTALVIRSLVEGELHQLRRAKATLLAAHALSRTLGPGHEAVASRVANNLGDTLYRLGELPQAILTLEEAERLRSGDPSGSGRGAAPARQLASTQMNLGEVLYRAGDYPRAIEYYRKAVRSHREWVGEHASRYCDAVTGLAGVLEASGRWDEALASLREAITIREAAVGAAPPSGRGPMQQALARSLTRLGALQHRMGSQDARGSLERALAAQESVLAGVPDPDHAETLVELAVVLLDAGDRRVARELLDRALAELAALDERGPLLLRARVLAAGMADNPVAGLRTLGQAARLARQLYGQGSPWTGTVVQARAELRLRAGDAAGALRDALLAQRISLPHVRTVVQAFPRDQALVFAADRRRSLDLALSLAAAAPGLPADEAGRVWQVASSSRMLVLNAELERQHLVAASADPHLAAVSARLAAARERYGYLLMRETATALERTQLRASRSEMQEAEEALAAGLRRRLSAGAHPAPSVHELRRRLPPGSALVAFFQARRPAEGGAYLAFVLARTGPVHLVNLGRVADLNWRIEKFREAILAVPGDAAARTRAGQALRQGLWDPLAAAIGGARTVFVVPDGGLYLMPWMALSAAGGGYLIEQGWSFQILASERDLVAAEVPRHPGRLLAVGGIDYDQAPPRVASLEAAPGPMLRGAGVPAGAAGPPASGSCQGAGLPSFAPLPGSRGEVEELAALWRRLRAEPGPRELDATVLTGRQATKEALRRAVPGQSVVHLATHGFAIGRRCGPARPAARGIGGLSLGDALGGGDPEQQLAGLVLAGANDRAAAVSGGQDGILTEPEILDLDLSAADWVVLSACDTGLGTILAGEGVVGLLRAFQVAGAKTVVVSLWPVDDQDARDWMRELYRARFERRLSTIAAVRQAALRKLSAGRRVGDDNPARWAGFAATGHWH